MDKMPIWYSLLPFSIFLFKISIIIIDRMNKLIEMMLPFIILYLLRIVYEASGINSMIEIPIMITIDNDREKVMDFST